MNIDNPIQGKKKRQKSSDDVYPYRIRLSQKFVSNVDIE